MNLEFRSLENAKGLIRRLALAASIGCLLLLALAAPSWGHPIDPSSLSLEELMNIEIVSASKRPQRLSDAAAAVFVLSQEDIRRSGATSIPEALRMVPGLEVARVDANKWAISARGFNDTFANNLLVLIDGRSVYTPLFSGVFWDVQDTLLEDVERIEVVRGPGATMWGANAVNGVINIVTKPAIETLGTLVTAGGGSEDRGSGAIRYGGHLGTNGSYRVYGKYFKRDAAVDASGAETSDDWSQWRTGFRLDWEGTSSDQFTLQGNLYQGTSGQEVNQIPSLTVGPQTSADEDNLAGGNLLGRWQRTLSGTSELQLQLYYDRAERPDALIGETRDTFDIDFQHRFDFGHRQEIVWGLGYRYTADQIDNKFTVSFIPDESNEQLISAFLQNEIELLPQRLRLTLGSKFEYNDYTGIEVQPNARLLWTPHTRHTFWAAVSRAVRTPSRAENDMQANVALLSGGPGGPALIRLYGDRDVEAEELLAYELGYRSQLNDRLHLDMTLFYNDYRNLIFPENRTPFFESSPAPPHLVIPLVFSNIIEGKSYGVELIARLQVSDRWQWLASYSYLRVDLRSDTGDVKDPGGEGNSPRHQFKLRSTLDLPHNLEFDSSLYYVDDLSGLEVSSYLRLDARLGWRPSHNLEFSVALQNLLDDRHPEFVNRIGIIATEVQRGIHAKLSWRY